MGSGYLSTWALDHYEDQILVLNEAKRLKHQKTVPHIVLNLCTFDNLPKQAPELTRRYHPRSPAKVMTSGPSDTETA